MRHLYKLDKIVCLPSCMCPLSLSANGTCYRMEFSFSVITMYHILHMNIIILPNITNMLYHQIQWHSFSFVNFIIINITNTFQDFDHLDSISH